MGRKARLPRNDTRRAVCCMLVPPQPHLCQPPPPCATAAAPARSNSGSAPTGNRGMLPACLGLCGMGHDSQAWSSATTSPSALQRPPPQCRQPPCTLQLPAEHQRPMRCQPPAAHQEHELGFEDVVLAGAQEAAQNRILCGSGSQGNIWCVTASRSSVRGDAAAAAGAAVKHAG